MKWFRANSGKGKSIKEQQGTDTAPAVRAKESAGIPGEVIAVIAAAVAVATGGRGMIQSIRESSGARNGQRAWRFAGLLENTRPFS